jgi:hypothetical protein
MDAYNNLARQLTQALVMRRSLQYQSNVMSRYWYEAEAAFIGQLCYRAEEWFTTAQLQALRRTTHLDEQEWSAYKTSFIWERLSQCTEA